MVIFLVIVGPAWPTMCLALEKQPPQAANAHERLDQALDSEGGAQVYKDHEGNVTTILNPPGGERRVTVQPPESPSMNLGPPLQLHKIPFQLPLTVAPDHPSPLDFPQKAR
jgi:hypothetical protein